ncbi:MAG: hypothetical protein KJ995_02435 [Candidatus Omnitrophica bacterium]|nr:hypothetical protein [Candidatus Omnitrophota bacterium]MBU1128759.1 hypothetical protein [Candidatus Omnitrophota bacterium]MBU1783984.1 hypothetical protein [Candidatus Omnitrophota bacterium]MBU1851248.1 hypothetical protein [Candidatus Omnitrophota bacterium]
MMLFKKMKRPVVVFSVCFVCLAAGLYFAFSRVDQIAIFLAGRLAGIHVSCGARRGNSLTSVYIRELEINSPKTGFTINAENAVFRIRWDELRGERRLVFDCQLKGVRFNVGTDKRVVGGLGSSLDALIRVPFDSRWKYRSITFTVLVDKGSVSVRPFDAVSDNVVVGGGSDYRPENGDAMLDMRMSFSPAISAGLIENFGQMFLTPEKDGWYGTSLTLEGNLKTGAFHLLSDRIEINISPSKFLSEK